MGPHAGNMTEYYEYLDNVDMYGNYGVGCNQGSTYAELTAQQGIDAARTGAVTSVSRDPVYETTETCAELGYTVPLGAAGEPGVTGWLKPSFADEMGMYICSRE